MPIRISQKPELKYQIRSIFDKYDNSKGVNDLAFVHIVEDDYNNIIDEIMQLIEPMKEKADLIDRLKRIVNK